MQYLVRASRFLPLVLLLAGCGGGSSGSSGAAGSDTPYTGPWFLVATLNVNIGGTATFLSDSSRVVVGASGNAVVTETDSECSVNVFVNGDVMTYETTCVFTATSDDATVPCTLTLRSRATIRGVPGSANLSGSFGPKTVVCSGAAAAYTGNLVGSQSGPPNADGETSNGNGNDTGNGEPG